MLHPSILLLHPSIIFNNNNNHHNKINTHNNNNMPFFLVNSLMVMQQAIAAIRPSVPRRILHIDLIIRMSSRRSSLHPLMAIRPSVPCQMNHIDLINWMSSRASLHPRNFLPSLRSIMLNYNLNSNDINRSTFVSRLSMRPSHQLAFQLRPLFHVNQ